MINYVLPTMDISGEQSEHDQVWVIDDEHEWRAVGA
jgi:hypothetical protein